MDVYVLYSAELDFRDSIIAVFTDLEEAQKCEEYNQSVNGIGSIRIEELELQNEFKPQGEVNYG